MKVKQISDTLFQVGENYQVKIQKKSGRTLLLCNCQNHTRFCIENPNCFHKQQVSRFLALKPIKEQLKKLIILYEGYGNMKIDARITLDELNK
ncbi:MAG: hypothetical protein KKF48_02655, partial [Nanoarchaeota archaeon]|nr:hypothetical protein [Nanoarchaeota archaeon]